MRAFSSEQRGNKACLTTRLKHKYVYYCLKDVFKVVWFIIIIKEQACSSQRSLHSVCRSFRWSQDAKSSTDYYVVSGSMMGRGY